MSNFAQLPPGMVFGGKYRIDRLIKAGGMGAVYQGVHTATMRKVAIKIMRPEIVADGTARERFTREAQISARIESQHCVDVLDAGIDPQTGVPFLVMELLVGKELGELLAERGRFSPQEVVTWLGQAARALDRAHASGIVHRDLKPENLFLVMREGELPTIKVLDFGIARILEGATNRATMAAGTPLYMAPEQTSRSAAVGPHTDVWALGLTAYTVLVGRPYWLGQDLAALYPEILAAPMEPPSQRAMRFGTHLPPQFDGWFFSCVERDPTRRQARPGEAIRQLGEVLGVAPQSLGVTPAGGPPPAATVMSPATPIVSGAYAHYGHSPQAGTMPVQGPVAGTAMMPMSGAPMTAMPPTPPMQGTPYGVAMPSNPVIPAAPAMEPGRRRAGGGNGALFAILGVAAVGLIGVGVWFAVGRGGSGSTSGSSGGATTTTTTTTQKTTAGDDDDDDDSKKQNNKKKN
jgi:serine/threonine-protein kinase